MSIQISGAKLRLASGPTSIALNDLSDVTIANPLDGQYLRYNQSILEWGNSFLNKDIFTYLNANMTGTGGISIIYTPGPNTISIGASLNTLTINNSGAGAAPGTTYNGSVARTISYNTVGAPSVTGDGAMGTWNISITGSVGSVSSVAITNDITTATPVFPTWVTANTGTLPLKVASTKLSFVPSSGILTATGFAGSGTGLTGTASGLTVGLATQVANTLTWNTSGTGAASGTSFNGSVARIISYNSIGAPSLTGAGASGTWAINTTGTIGTQANINATGTIRAGINPNGAVTLVTGTTTASGYVAFLSGGNVRQSFIGQSTTTAALDQGNLIYSAPAGHSFYGGIQTNVTVVAASHLQAGVSPNGFVRVVPGSANTTGYIDFVAANGNRQGFIGNSSGTGATDTGTISYNAGAHYFAGSITTTSSLSVNTSVAVNTGVYCNGVYESNLGSFYAKQSGEAGAFQFGTVGQGFATGAALRSVGYYSELANFRDITILNADSIGTPNRIQVQYMVDIARTQFVYTVGNTLFYMINNGYAIAPGGWVTPTDFRTRDNLQPIPDALSKVKQLTGYTFERNDMDGKLSAGYVAQELQAVLPQAVDSFYHKGHDAERLHTSDSAVIALLINAIKELNEKVESLTAQINIQG